MKKILKRITSVLLIFGILFSGAAVLNFDLFSVISFADNPNAGKCGESVYWTYDAYEKKLTISGVFAMDDFEFFSDEDSYPSHKTVWYYIHDKVETLTVSEGVTYVGGWAFAGFENLKTVTISSTVESIGRQAFDGCKKLSSVSIIDSEETPSRLKNIGMWSFNRCSSLENFTFPASLEVVDRAAFSGSGLKEVVIPYTLEVLGRDVFAGCENLEYVSLPYNMDTIGRGVFACCTKLKEIKLPDWLHFVSREMFSGCTSLEKVTFPGFLEGIGMNAFEGCVSLNEIIMPDNIIDIGMNAFDNTGYYHKEENWENGALYIDEYLVAVKETTDTFIVKNGTKCTASYIFDDCDNLETLVLPKSVKNISSYPFGNCENVKDIFVFGDSTNIEYIGDSILSKATVHCYANSTAHQFLDNNESESIYTLMYKTNAGDANGDNAINSADALKVLLFAVGAEQTIDGCYYSMDTNLDDKINSADALAILKYSVGLINEF